MENRTILKRIFRTHESPTGSGEIQDVALPVVSRCLGAAAKKDPHHEQYTCRRQDFCGGVLFVVRAGSTNFELAAKASEEFRERNLLGVVLNRVEKRDSYGDYYYGYDPDRNGDVDTKQ